MWAEFGQKDRDAKSDRNGENHGDRGSDQRAVDRRERAEFFRNRVPYLRGEEAEPERLDRGEGADDQRPDDAAENQQHRKGGGERQQAEAVILQLQPAQSLDPISSSLGRDAVN